MSYAIHLLPYSVPRQASEVLGVVTDGEFQ